MHHDSAGYHNAPARQLAAVHHWRRIGLWLVGATMAYNTIEGGVALWAGIQAGSIALVGFGLDSFIECTAATALFWRLGVEARGASAEAVERSEQRVRRFVGGTFLALALYVLLQAGWTLWKQDTVAESVIGIILAGVSLVVMPLVAWGNCMQPRLCTAPRFGQRRRRPSLAPIYPARFCLASLPIRWLAGGGQTPSLLSLWCRGS